MLNTLILANRSIEHNAFFSIQCASGKRSLAKSNGLCCNQNSLWIKPVQYIGKTFSFFSNKVMCWNFQLINEDFIGIYTLAAHFFNFTYINTRAI